MASQDHEFELEDELSSEAGLEGEEFAGINGSGPTLGEGPSHEYHDGGPAAHEFEDELEGGALHEFEDELLGEGGHGEFESEFEDEGENFSFGKIFSGVKRFVQKAAPILKQVAQVAAPLVGTALGGPLGGVLGKAAASALGEDELEFEFELEAGANGFGEDEFEFEGTGEGEDEAELEAATAAPITHAEALGELMCAVASRSQSEAEAEAMIGACAATILTRRDRRELRRLLPHMIRAVAVLQRVLRRRSVTRPAVRTIPTILTRSAQILTNRARAGHPVTQRTAARVLAQQTHRVLSSPRLVGKAIARNVKATRSVRSSTGGGSAYRPSGRSYGSSQRRRQRYY